MRTQSRYVAYVDDHGTECCHEGHETRREATDHAEKIMRERAEQQQRREREGRR